MTDKYVKKLLKHEGVSSEIVSLAGERSLQVLNLLTKLQDDEKIAQKLNVKVSDVRSVLNKLNQEGIVYYNRTKDPETGWFYYQWVLEPTKLREWFAKKVEGRRKFFYGLVLEGDHYFCADCGIDSPYSFEIAMDYEFSCPLHQKSLELIDEDVIEKHLSSLPSIPPLPKTTSTTEKAKKVSKPKARKTAKKLSKKPSKKKPEKTAKKASKPTKTSKNKKPASSVKKAAKESSSRKSKTKAKTAKAKKTTKKQAKKKR